MVFVHLSTFGGVMEFNSHLFILFFLPMVLLLFILASRLRMFRFSYSIILVASLLFYGINSINFLLLLLALIVLNYILSMQICITDISSRRRKLILASGICANLGVLVWFKYFNLLVDTYNLLMRSNYSIRELIMPLGISFLTFQQISYLVDVYREKKKIFTFGEYLLFVMFFPHIISGPILVSYDIRSFFDKKKIDISYEKMARGILLFSLGLGKKVLIADVLSQAVDWGYSNLEIMNSTEALFISLIYTLQIYFDFSGYSDMAVGIAKMMQVDIPINFNSPYKAKTIDEFWDRWHMTLTGFFTRYLYIPLGGNRKGKVRTYINILIVFTLSGLWHGASYAFVAWGILHGIFMCITRMLKKYFDMIPSIVNWMVTFAFVNFTWILFRAGSFTTFKKYVNRLTFGGWGSISDELISCFQLKFIGDISIVENIPKGIFAVLFILIVLIITLTAKNTNEIASDFKPNMVSLITVVIILFASLISITGVTTFVYQLF